MDFFGWALTALCLALCAVLAVACLIQVGWVARSATRLVREHLPHH